MIIRTDDFIDVQKFIDVVFWRLFPIYMALDNEHILSTIQMMAYGSRIRFLSKDISGDSLHLK